MAAPSLIRKCKLKRDRTSPAHLQGVSWGTPGRGVLARMEGTERSHTTGGSANRRRPFRNQLHRFLRSTHSVVSRAVLLPAASSQEGNSRFRAKTAYVDVQSNALCDSSNQKQPGRPSAGQGVNRRCSHHSMDPAPQPTEGSQQFPRHLGRIARAFGWVSEGPILHASMNSRDDTVTDTENRSVVAA